MTAWGVPLPAPKAHSALNSSPSSQGYGFVQFALAEDAERAAQLFDGTDLEGRKIQVELADKRAPMVDRKRKRGGEEGAEAAVTSKGGDVDEAEAKVDKNKGKAKSGSQEEGATALAVGKEKRQQQKKKSAEEEAAMLEKHRCEAPASLVHLAPFIPFLSSFATAWHFSLPR